MRVDFLFTRIDNKYKITYIGSEPIYVNITALLRGIDAPVETIRFKFKISGEWFIPNIDYTGISKIEIREIGTNKHLIDKIIDKDTSPKSKGQNIICIGLNKTGTSSFVSGVKKLGYNMFGEGTQLFYLSSNVYHNDWFPTLSVLNNPRYNLFNDNPFSFPNAVQKIYPYRPDDIYVLTIRKNPETWFNSCYNFYPNLKSKLSVKDSSVIDYRWSNDDQKTLVNHLYPMFDSWDLHDLKNLKERLIDVYEKHIEDTVNFFKGKIANFEIVDVSEKGSLGKFSKWIGIESEEKDFPWENRTIV